MRTLVKNIFNSSSCNVEHSFIVFLKSDDIDLFNSSDGDHCCSLDVDACASQNRYYKLYPELDYNNKTTWDLVSSDDPTFSNGHRATICDKSDIVDYVERWVLIDILFSIWKSKLTEEGVIHTQLKQNHLLDRVFMYAVTQHCMTPPFFVLGRLQLLKKLGLIHPRIVVKSEMDGKMLRVFTNNCKFNNTDCSPRIIGVDDSMLNDESMHKLLNDSLLPENVLIIISSVVDNGLHIYYEMLKQIADYTEYRWRTCAKVVSTVSRITIVIDP